MHNLTPVFSSPANELFTSSIDIALNDKLIGILNPGNRENEYALDYKPATEEYKRKHVYQPTEEMHSFTGDDITFSEDDYKVPDKLESDVQIILEDPTKDLTSSVGDVLESFSKQTPATLSALNSGPSVDYTSIDSEDISTPKTTYNEQTISAGGIDYKLTILEEDGEITKFKFSDGKKSQVFKTDFLMMLTDSGPDGIRFENNEIYLSYEGISGEEPLGVTPVGPEILTGQDKEILFESPTNKTFQTCLDSLSDFLGNKDLSEKQIKSFLKVQGELTLHRLAWANLKLESPKEKIENKILNLIKKKYHSENIEVTNEFDKMNKKSRNFLAKSLPLIKDILNDQLSQDSTEERPFYINLSDTKMLEILASFEELKADNFDHRQFDTSHLPNNIVNFTTLVNSAYLHSDKKLKDQKSILNNQEVLKKHIPKLSHNLDNIIRDIIYKACVEQNGLSCGESKAIVDLIFEKDISLLTSNILGTISKQRDSDFIDDLRYKKLWLRVAK